MSKCTTIDLNLLLRAEAAGASGAVSTRSESAALKRLVRRKFVETYPGSSARYRITGKGTCFLEWALDELTRYLPEEEDARTAYNRAH